MANKNGPVQIHMVSRVKVAEWWEVWWAKPGHKAYRVRPYGRPEEERLDAVGFASRAEALEQKRRTGRYGKLVHVVRYRRKRHGE